MFIPQMFRGKSQSGGSFWQAMLGGVSSSRVNFTGEALTEAVNGRLTTLFMI